MYPSFSWPGSGGDRVDGHAEVFDGPGRGEVGLLFVYDYPERVAKREKLAYVLSGLGLRGGQDQPVVQVSQ